MEPVSNSKPPWLAGALVATLGVVVGTASLVLFCYALGLNLQDEGWSDAQVAWGPHPIALASSLVGFAISILLFWLGFVRITRSKP